MFDPVTNQPNINLGNSERNFVADSRPLNNYLEIKVHDVALERINAQNKFSGLGQNWWKQIFDGKYHQFGSMVFDQGLHKRRREEGFYNSAYNAYLYANEQLLQPLTLNFYFELHKKACAHFEGKKNNTEMDKLSIGKFRSQENTQSSFSFVELLRVHDYDEDLINEYVKVKKYSSNLDLYGVEWVINDLKSDPPEIENLTVSKFNELDNVVNNDILKFKKYIDSLKKTDLNGALPSIQIVDDVMILNYPCDNITQFAKKIIDDFNNKISTLAVNAHLAPAEMQKEKLLAIADLFQKLELLHPFQDGQGRTDVILLSKLLCEHGFNPAILYDPYVSSYVPLEDWYKYLERGMQEWLNEAALT